MQPLELKIFQSNNTFWGEVTSSQYIFWISICLIFALSFIFNFFRWNFSFLIILFFPLIASYIISMFEYENLNGKIIGKITIEENFISINEEKFNYNEIENIKLETISYKGKRNSHSSTDYPKPLYLIGKDNRYKILAKSGKQFSGLFIIDSEIDVYKINNKLSDLIFSETIKTDIHKLYNLPILIQENKKFKPFVEKLIIEKRIDCGYGIALIGYNSDKEAKRLREKYCS